MLEMVCWPSHKRLICSCWDNSICHAYSGVPEGGTCRINGSGSETDKQLVHQSEETPLEAFRGHAICCDGWYSSPLLHGQCYVQSLSNGLHKYAPSMTFYCHCNNIDATLLTYQKIFILMQLCYVWEWDALIFIFNCLTFQNCYSSTCLYQFSIDQNYLGLYLA